MAFGNPTRYIMLDPSKVRPILVDGSEDGRLCTPSIKGPSTAPVSIETLRGPDAWDTCVAESNGIYARRIHNIWYDL